MRGILSLYLCPQITLSTHFQGANDVQKKENYTHKQGGEYVTSVFFNGITDQATSKP